MRVGGTLSALAPGKVNLCLLLGPTRADGLHELVSLVQSVSLADELTLGPAGPGAEGDEVHCPGVEGPNLVAAALAAFREETGWSSDPVRVIVEKRVPVAGGMGGGSGDAAAALRLAVHVAGTGEDVARGLAPGLGADVPAQLAPGLHLVGGAGEELELLAPRALFGVLILPDPEPLPTSDVFAEADRLGLGRPADELAVRRHELREALGHGDDLPPPELLVNDLEPAALSLRPRIAERLEAARAAGATTALVSGSGPTVFGLFSGMEGAGLASAAAAELDGFAAVPVEAGWAGVR